MAWLQWPSEAGSADSTVLRRAGAAEFVLARGREAQYERSRPVTPVPDISLGAILAEVLGRTASTGAGAGAGAGSGAGAGADAGAGAASSATAPPPPATAEPAAVPPAAADASAPLVARPSAPLIYHAGPIEGWGESLGGEAAGLYSNPDPNPQPHPGPQPWSEPLAPSLLPQTRRYSPFPLSTGPTQA